MTCPVCGGRKIVTHRLMGPLPAVYVPPKSDVVPVPTTSQKDYPCPECQPYAPYERLWMLRGMTQIEKRHHREEVMDRIRRDTARAMVDAILKADLITFEERDDPDSIVRIMATVGVVSKKVVADLESRIAERQMDVVNEVADEAVRNINVWNSHYEGSGGSLYKSQARDSVREAVATVRLKRSRKAPARQP